MKILNIILVFAASLTVFTGLTSANGAAASDPETLLVYRESDGKMSSEVHKAVAKLKSTAATNGFIELWLYIDSTVQFGTDSVSDDQYNQACVEILQPLVNSGHVSHPTAGPLNSGPICFVRATAAGVAQLAGELRFKQIMGSTHAH